MKQISAKVHEDTIKQIQELKQFYAECWNCSPDTITTTDIITWSIGMLHGVKVKQNFRWVTLDDFENGDWRTFDEELMEQTTYEIKQNNR